MTTVPDPTATLSHDVPEVIAPGVVRLVAANPGMMTGPGTNTYILGRERVAVVDPGPDDPRHLEAILETLPGRLQWILVTHTHPDHAPGAAALAARTGARRLGYDSRDGFVADDVIGDGFELRLDGLVVRAIHTPGHASNHLCYLADLAGSVPVTRMLFSGDHIMGGSTVVIGPPDGDMSAYLSSLRRVLDCTPPVDSIAPGHGPVITQPARIVEAYLQHRAEREERVCRALAAVGFGSLDDLLPVVYDDVDSDRHPVARRSLWAHLRKLEAEGRVTAGDPDREDTRWSWCAGAPDGDTADGDAADGASAGAPG